MGRTEQNGHDGPLRIAGRYRLVEKLGTGGMSVVWRGYDETLGRDVAVKVLSPTLAEDRTFRDRLRQEALAAARLCHPHITGIHDFGEAMIPDGVTVPYVVMELNDGESLAARISRQGSLDWREAVIVAAEVASALATAHARGVVHRDVTPANVMLTGSGAKVVDFGISALAGQRDAAPDGSLLGTPAYLAPERLGGSCVSPATDVYALGLLLYRALTGHMPWSAENTAEALRAHLYADPDPVPDLPGLPLGVADLCLRCLAKSPDGRPAAAEIARALGATVGLRPIIPPLRSGERSAVPAARAVVRIPGAGGGRMARFRVRAGMRLLTALHLGRARPLGGGIFRAGRVFRAAPSVYRSAVATSVTAPPATSTAAGSAAVGVTATTSTSAAAMPITSTSPEIPVFSLLRSSADAARPGLTALARRLSPRLLPRRDRMPALAALAAVVLLAATTLNWSFRRESRDAEQAQTTAAGAGGPAVAAGADTIRCSVRYQVRRDSGADFEARLTVVAGDEPGDWRVEFSYPGTQRLAATPKSVTQHGRRVVVRGQGRTRALTLRGGYRNRNPLPLAFKLDGRPCRAEVLGSTNPQPAADDSVSTSTVESPRVRDKPGKRKRPPADRGGATPRKRVTPAPQGPPAVPVPKRGTGFSLAF
ncbi:serine/threonine-protein kinase [Actinoplanes rectilineatus]|uniref:serine/threonine-protein kinase n=1 Tax=Actinoplanes rectilineatus TaxID=113571 RepID=UPI0005F27F91|nr:serine/threonine-protein kinase [Actinoplanes rectilineatus]